MVFFGRQEAIPNWGTGGADKIAAMGNYYRRLFILRGVASDKIVVTGYPLLDSVPTCGSQFSSDNFLQKTKLTPDRALILLITQPFVEDGQWSPSLREMLVKAVINSVKQINGQLIIKLHPRES